MGAEAEQQRGILVSGRFPELEAALVERVRELRAGRPLVPLTVVVGSSAVRTHVGDLLVRRLSAVANVSVLTLAQLARRLATEARGAPPLQLAGLARERLLRRLVTEQAGRGFAYFGPVADRPHFPLALAATFADLRQALVRPDTAWARAGLGPQAAGKSADLEALYSVYCTELDRLGLADDAQVHGDAARWVRGAAGRPSQNAGTRVPAVGAGPPVVVYGIYDLNSAQGELVAALLDAGADAFVPAPRGGQAAATPASDKAAVTLPGDEAEVTPASEEASGVLGLGLAAGGRLSTLASPVAVKDVDRLSAVWRSQGPGAAALAPLGGDGSLAVVSVPDERAEGREAVRAIVASVSAGAGSWECAVVVPHREDAERIGAALVAAGLPVACRLPDRSPGPRVLARLAECLAPPAGPPFARRAVLELLGTAPLLWEVPAGEAARWLDEARRAGVVAGLGQWVERTARRRRGRERAITEAVAAGEEARQAEGDDDAERLDLLRRDLAAARSLETAVAALARACGALPARARWAEWARALGGALDAVFAAEVAAAARDAATRLGMLDVLHEEVDALTMAAALREQVAGGTVQAGRAGRHGVAVLTPLEMRGLSFHTVVFTGLADGGFPARGRPDPLFGDGARMRLRDHTGARLPLAEERSAESLLLFAFSCEAAREKLTLIAPRTDAASGRPRLPSRVLMRLASLAAGSPVGLDDFLSGVPLAPVWRHVGGTVEYAEDRRAAWVDAAERDTAALLALSGSGGRAGAQVYLAAVLADEAAACRRTDMWLAARDPEPGARDGLLGAAARAALTARHPFDSEMHPTRLERYVSCPFAFLLRDVLGLEAPDEPGESLEMEPREFGTLAHRILQSAFGELVAAWPETGSGPDVAAAQAAVDSAWRTGCARAEALGVTGAPLAWSVTREMLREDLLETVRRDPVFAGDGRPLQAEWSFGEAAGQPVALELPGGRRVRFAGRVDRVDITASGARVIDYKTGKGNSERERLKAGLSVQLPVYQLAVRQAGDAGHAEVAGLGEIVSLYRLVTRKGGFESLPLAENEPDAAARLARLVAGAAALVDAGMFPRTTAGRCEYCDVGYACGTSPWSRARKRGHPALSDVLALQAGRPREDEDDA